MKKIISILLSFSIVFLSVSTCISISVCADTDKTVLSKSSDSPFAYSSSEAQKYVSAHLDIYDSDNTLLFSYTPTSTYNWTYSAKGKDNLHLSDNQLKAFLMSKKTLSAYVQLMFSGFSNNNVTRGFLSALGIATTGNSNALTDVSDKLLGNYNYIDSINYNEDTQTITMDNTSVDKLREEIKKYYYDSIGLISVKPSDSTHNPAYLLERYSGFYQYEEDYYSDFNALSQYDFGIGVAVNDYSYLTVVGFDKNSYSYAFLSGSDATADAYIRFVDKDMKCVNTSALHVFIAVNGLYDRTAFDYDLPALRFFSSKLCPIFLNNNNGSYSLTKQFMNSSFIDNVRFYSKNNKSFVYFSSYEKLFNFLNGSQTAYLSSRIDKAGEDITFSIKDMNENLGSKMDTLIDSINDKKGSMSADELQNAIDKGLADLNKNTEDIKDNVEETNNKLDGIIEILQEQNQILLDILGITKKIYDKTEDIKKDADFNNVVSSINVIFNAVQCALLYGKNTLKDDSEADTQSLDYASSIAVYSSDTAYKPKILQMDLRSGIFGHFPFSMIYHMYDWCAAFVAKEKAPVFSYNYGFLVGDKGNPDFTISIDLSQYESWRDVAASFLKLAMTLAVAYGSYKRFKEEML